LWQEGIKTVYMINNHGTHLFDDEAKKRFDTFIQMSGMKISYVDPDLTWLRQLCGVI
jgi:hypothetical protein